MNELSLNFCMFILIINYLIIYSSTFTTRVFSQSKCGNSFDKDFPTAVGQVCHS